MFSNGKPEMYARRETLMQWQIIVHTYTRIAAVHRLLASAAADLRDKAVVVFSLDTIEVAAVTTHLKLATFSQCVYLSPCVCMWLYALWPRQVLHPKLTPGIWGNRYVCYVVYSCMSVFLRWIIHFCLHWSAALNIKAPGGVNIAVNRGQGGKNVVLANSTS